MKSLIMLLIMTLPVVVSAGPVPAAPTGHNDVPDAILGKGVLPQGTTVNYYPANTKAAGYLAVPEGDGPHGAVLLIHEWNGLVDRVRQIADAFAAEGYVALAADLYSGRTGTNPEENIALVQEVSANQAEINANLNAAVSFLKARADVTGKVATIGWCFGGGIALSYALGGDNHEGTAIFYGNLLQDPEKMQHIDHEIYGTFAGQDERITVEHVDNFVATLRKAGIENDVHIYDDVQHGFWLYVERDPDSNFKPALDAWQRLKAYLKRTVAADETPME